MLNTKEDIFKNVANQTVDGRHWLPFGCQWGPSKYILCSAEERNSYRFETTWGWV